MTLYSTIHKPGSAKSRVCRWDGETALRDSEFHFLQVISAQVLKLKGSAQPQGLYVQETYRKYQSDSP